MAARMRQDGSMQPRDFSLYGAVDLGARQAAAQAAQRRQQAASSAEPDGSGSGLVIDVTEETFTADVVERSRTTPVIIDLWADWCGPCKQLSPVLEKLAAEADGQWILAKVDVDANPQLSAALQVQSIPMVVAVIGGQLVDGFLGAMPEAQVRQWLGQVLEVAEKMGLTVADGPPGAPDDETGDETGEDAAAAAARAVRAGARAASRRGAGAGGYGDAGQVPPAYAEARAAMERGDLDAAARAFEEQLKASPGDPVATTGLAQVNLIRRVSSYDQARARRDAAEHPADVAAQVKVADIDLASGRVEEAFDRLLGVVRRTSGEDRDQARAHLVSLFEILSPRDPRVTKARATLSALLF
jgi:putative thioredoxin